MTICLAGRILTCMVLGILVGLILHRWDGPLAKDDPRLMRTALKKVAGIDHVGLGGDFDGIVNLVEGLEDVSTYPALIAELVRRGWSDADVRKLLGENLLRVMRAAEKVADR